MANKVWSLTISALGSSTGPFKVTDNFGTIVANNVPKVSLLGGTTVTVVSNASSLTVTDLSACGLSKTISLGTGFVASRSGSFTRNNCLEGFNGSTVVFNNTYSSMVSQAQAEALADANFPTDGQAYANVNGVCTQTVNNCFNYQVYNPATISRSFRYIPCGSTMYQVTAVGAGQYSPNICAVDNTMQDVGVFAIKLIFNKLSNC